MNTKARMPGFTAAVVLESTTQQNYYARAHSAPSSQQVVTPQGGRMCGFLVGSAGAAAAMGIFPLAAALAILALAEC